MENKANEYDAIVVGGGFAGISAARDLTDSGLRTVVLEARDRCGGQTWNREFGNTGVILEMGGGFVVPEKQHYVMSELERYSLGLRSLPAATEFPTIFGELRNPGPLPVPLDQIKDFERALVYCINAASRITPGVPLDLQNLHDIDVTWTEFLAPLNLPLETFDYLSTFVAQLGGRFADEGGALQVLYFLAAADLSPYAFWGELEFVMANGTSSLINAMAADVAEVRLETPVASLEQDADGVRVRTAAGELFRASQVVLAMPHQLWGSVEISPPLSDFRQEIIKDPNCIKLFRKFHAIVRDATSLPALFAGPATSKGLSCAWVDQVLDNGDQVVTSFALAALDGSNPDGEYALDTREGVEAAMRVWRPDVEIVDVDPCHNWWTDPYTRGLSIGWKPGPLSQSHSKFAKPEGRIHFASSDISHGYIGWMDGAIERGRSAAAAIVRILGPDQA